MDTRLLAFLGVTCVVMAVPGPSVLYAVTQRMRSGPAAGALAVLGLESGLALHVAAACLGVSTLVAASDTLLRALQVGGAGYLGWLGIRLLTRSGGSPHPAAAPGRRRGLAGVYLGGLLVDLLNPKTVLFFVAVLPQFVDARAGSVPGQSALLGSCAVALGVLVDGGYTVLAGRAVRHGIPAWVQRWGGRASGGAFCALAALALLG
jgi:threonine/homoserine/homoserine lactone efflux protein